MFQKKTKSEYQVTAKKNDPSLSPSDSLTPALQVASFNSSCHCVSASKGLGASRTLRCSSDNLGVGRRGLCIGVQVRSAQPWVHSTWAGHLSKTKISQNKVRIPLQIQSYKPRQLWHLISQLQLNFSAFCSCFNMNLVSLWIPAYIHSNWIFECGWMSHFLHTPICK